MGFTQDKLPLALVDGHLAIPTGGRRPATVVGRVLAELPAAVDEVAAMPAGGEGLDRFADAIAERARTIGEHAALEGLSDVESTPEPAAGASHYDG